MWKEKLCLGLSESFDISEQEQIRLFKEIGFDGFFCQHFEGKDLRVLRRIADEDNMIFQSVHAPFFKMRDIWYDEEKSVYAIKELNECIEKTADIGVPIVVMHAYIGFEQHPSIPEKGLNNIDLLVRKAEDLNVKIAFENTEGEEFLSTVMKRYEGNSSVGFCWDTGHEICYNKSNDMMSLYGDRLLCTHINDNLGIKDYNGEITYIDDLHLLPFDGVVNWQDVAERLVLSGFKGELTFELNKKSKGGKTYNDVYTKMEIKDYIVEAYKRACRFAYLKKRVEITNSDK